MISFSKIVKEEIVFNDFDIVASKAILCAIIKMNGSLSLGHAGLSLTLRTENAKIAKKVHHMLKELYQPQIEFRVSRKMKLNKNNVYILMISKGREILSYLKDNNYIVVDTDIVFGDRPSDNKESLELRELFKNKEKESLIDDFDNCYLEILNYYKNSDKTIVIDSAQYRNIKDISILKGEVIVMRTSIDTCYERVLNRWKSIKEDYNEVEYQKYADRKKGIFSWYKSINKFIADIDKM